MPEEQGAELKGQPADGDFDALGTEPGPTEMVEPNEQSVEPEVGTSEPAPQAEDTFFDPTTVPDELKPAYKNMQASYTKKMQAVSANRQKVEAYDAFSQNPIGEMQRLAQMYGYQLVQPGQQQQPTAQQSETEWQPQSWGEVEERISNAAYERAKREISQQYEPVVNQVKELKQEVIERELSEIDPTWQQYEEQMAQTLKEHPTLASDPSKLYQLSVPREVLESRATQKALRKMEAKGVAAQVGGTSKTSKKPVAGLPDGPLSFDDAVKFAKQKLMADGIKAPG